MSDSRFEHENLRHIAVKSPSLRGRGDITLYLPEAGAGASLPLVLLLHGVYGSHWSWAYQGGVHRTARALIEAEAIGLLAIAMPSDGLWGDGSGYLRHPSRDYERWIVEEVPAAVRETAASIRPDAPLFIAGLSMGGFGALRLGAAYPDRFMGLAGHSSITHFDQLAAFVEEPLEAYAAPESNRSVLETMRRNRAHLPPIRFDCGTEDPLLDANRALHRALSDEGISHTYEEFPGGHEWPYWEHHIVRSLRFFDTIARKG